MFDTLVSPFGIVRTFFEAKREREEEMSFYRRLWKSVLNSFVGLIRRCTGKTKRHDFFLISQFDLDFGEEEVNNIYIIDVPVSQELILD